MAENWLQLIQWNFYPASGMNQVNFLLLTFISLQFWFNRPMRSCDYIHFRCHPFRVKPYYMILKKKINLLAEIITKVMFVIWVALLQTTDCNLTRKWGCSLFWNAVMPVFLVSIWILKGQKPSGKGGTSMIFCWDWAVVWIWNIWGFFSHQIVLDWIRLE